MFELSPPAQSFSSAASALSFDVIRRISERRDIPSRSSGRGILPSLLSPPLPSLFLKSKISNPNLLFPASQPLRFPASSPRKIPHQRRHKRLRRRFRRFNQQPSTPPREFPPPLPDQSPQSPLAPNIPSPSSPTSERNADALKNETTSTSPRRTASNGFRSRRISFQRPVANHFCNFRARGAKRVRQLRARQVSVRQQHFLPRQFFREFARQRRSLEFFRHMSHKKSFSGGRFRCGWSNRRDK